MPNSGLKELLQGLATHARDVAEKIQQPPRSNSMPWGMPKAFDKELRDIEAKLDDVVKAIDKYNGPGR
jgi:hypothetical protein